MARVRNTMNVVEKSIGCIDARYCLRTNNIEDIVSASHNVVDLGGNGFRFGYMQGMKAAQSGIQKGGAANA